MYLAPAFGSGPITSLHRACGGHELLEGDHEVGVLGRYGVCAQPDVVEDGWHPVVGPLACGQRWRGRFAHGQPRNDQDVPQDALDDVDVEAVAQGVSLAP
eukprot:16429129-Heterocapsa_arctica.AAC.1